MQDFFFLVKNIVGSDNHPFIVNSTSFHVVFLFCIKANGLLVELSMNFVRMLSWWLWLIKLLLITRLSALGRQGESSNTMSCLVKDQTAEVAREEFEVK